MNTHNNYYLIILVYYSSHFLYEFALEFLCVAAFLHFFTSEFFLLQFLFHVQHLHFVYELF